MVSKAQLGVMLALALSVGWNNVLDVSAASITPTNLRTFYFASPGKLSPSSPTGPTAFKSNLTSPVTFDLKAPLLSSATIAGQMSFSLWTNSSSAATIVASLRYKLGGQANWNNETKSPPHQITVGINHFNISYSVPETPLIVQTIVAVGISVTSLPPRANITLNWGSSTQPSLVVLPLSGYEAFFPLNPITIVDRSEVPTSNFYLNAPPASNIVLVKTLVVSALGFTDISRVNMTIVDDHVRPVRSATNITMTTLANPTTPPPYQYIGTWIYPSNATQGTYQVLVNIIDSERNLAYTSPQGTASFGLVPQGFIPFPYNLIPYFLIAGVAGAGVAGTIYYRKRRRKSYFVPFEHFNTLTGGGLNEGTVVTIEGNTGSGKTLLAEQLMYQDLRSGRACVFVTTIDFPSNIRSNMRALGLDVTGYEQSGLLTFVDAYSAEAGQESRERVSVPSLGDLTTLGMKISSTLPSSAFKGGSLYFDSLSPLASKAKPESIVSFVQSVGAKVKGLAGKAFFTMGPGIDASVQRQLEENADCIVEMEAFEETGSRRRRLRIAKLRARKYQEGWTEFTIEDGKGIIFYSRTPKK